VAKHSAWPRDLEKWKGKLKGKIVLADAVRDSAMLVTPLGHRYTDTELAELEVAPEPGASPFFRGGPGGPGGAGRTAKILKPSASFRTKRAEFFKDRGRAGSDFHWYKPPMAGRYLAPAAALRI